MENQEIEVTESMRNECEKLVDYMRKGYAIIAYQKKIGVFYMGIATLKNYEEFFNKEFDFSKLHNTIPYWNAEEKGWRTFQIENLMSWKKMGRIY